MDRDWKNEAKIHTKKGSISPPIIGNQFPSALAWAFVVYKVEGLSLKEGVFDFNLKKLWTGQKLSSSTFIIDDTPKDYKMNINNIENKFLSLAYGC